MPGEDKNYSTAPNFLRTLDKEIFVTGKSVRLTGYLTNEEHKARGKKVFYFIKTELIF
jgi:hypothetical protein